MYPELMVIPMREELTRLGIQELRTSAEVDTFLQGPGTAMIVVNSICGCAAGRMRPAVRLALEHETKPEKLATVFAGQDREATERVRSLGAPAGPSLPGHVASTAHGANGLWRDGAPAGRLPRGG